MTLRLAPGVVLAAILSAPPASVGQDAPMMTKGASGQPVGPDADLAMCHPDGIAVGGYDLVSYHDDAGPVQGTEEFRAEHDGLYYQFASAYNRAAFVAEPDRYLPAYAGFCAITLALGRVTCPEYTNYQIEDGRLYLFEVTGFTNGRTLWNSDADQFRRRADENFTDLLDLQ
jgi:hypothetical protein